LWGDLRISEASALDLDERVFRIRRKSVVRLIKHQLVQNKPGAGFDRGRTAMPRANLVMSSNIKLIFLLKTSLFRTLFHALGAIIGL
jgi:hypothetical protein